MPNNNSTVGVPNNNSYNVDITSIDISNLNLINTTLGTAVVAPGLYEVTPGSMENIIPGISLRIDVLGSFQDEIVVVRSITDTTFTAYFSIPHNNDTLVTLDAGRQVMVIGDSDDYNAIAKVGQGQASPNDYALTVRPAGTFSVSLSGNGQTQSAPLYTTNVILGQPVPISSIVSSVPLIANGQSLIESNLITANKTAVLRKVIVSASGPVKWELQTQGNNAATPQTIETIFTTSNQLNYVFKFDDGEVSIPNADGNSAKFQVVATNMDQEFTFDVYITFYWREM